MSPFDSDTSHPAQEEAQRFGRLPPRYRFILNPYRDYRFTRCPDCSQPTRWRKFVLVVHVDPMILVAQNIHCRYCPACDLLIVHQDALETQLAAQVSQYQPSAVGNDYLVLGTMDHDAWAAGRRTPPSLDQALDHIAGFREVLEVSVRPGGWYPEGEN